MAITVTPTTVLEYEMENHDADQAAVAAQLVAWAEDDSVEHAEGADPCNLLVSAADHLGYAGDFEGQLALLDRAEGAEGDSLVKLDAHRVGALLHLGRIDEAKALADALRKGDPPGPFTCEVMAEAYLDHGDNRQAVRWLNIGLRQLEDADPSEGIDTGMEILLLRRYHIRREASMPIDAYDEEAEWIIAQAEAEQDGDDG